jgi:hypothetical protein
MVALSGVGFGIFFLVSLAVGLRLVALATRTHRSPELLIGIGILGIGPTGMGCILGAAALHPLSPPASTVFTAAGLLAIACGSIASCLFNRMVFRTESSGARAWVVATTALFGVAFGYELATTGFADPLHPGPGGSFVSLLCTLNLLWGAGESLRYWRLMRRRLRLGLADPLVTNRFLLWGLGIGAAGLGSLISLIVQQVVGLSMAELPALTFSNSLFGLCSALLMWVAFLPPAAWRRFVQGEGA